MDLDFYLKEPGGRELWLPVNPGEVMIRREKQLETVQIVGLGEIDFPQGEKVKEISFSSFFPKTYDSSYCRYSALPDPQAAMNLLNDFMLSKKPLQLLITETDVNVWVFVSAHSSSFKGGEPGDVYYDVTCRTWREVKVRTLATADGGALARPDLQPIPTVYEVVRGDSLWLIAKRFYGDGSRYSDIYKANKETIGPSADLIFPGQRLVIPQ